MPRTIYPATPELKQRRRKLRRKVADESDPDMPVLSVRMIADKLGIHPHLVRRFIHEGKLRAVNFGSRAAGYRVTPRDFHAFVDSLYEKEDGDDGMF